MPSVEMDVPAIRYRWIRQRQAPSGQIAKAGCIPEQLNSIVSQLDADRSTLDGCDDPDLTAIARDRQRDLVHRVGMGALGASVS